MGDETVCSDNKWYAAIKKCEEINMHLPTRGELIQFYCQANGPSILFSGGNVGGGCSSNYPNIKSSNIEVTNKLKDFGIFDRVFWASGALNANRAWYVGGPESKVNTGTITTARAVVCIGK
ncbi:hypothetical protein J6G99_06945 [bacterium]|nr:hypothetical protein [bacterium]